MDGSMDATVRRVDGLDCQLISRGLITYVVEVAGEESEGEVGVLVDELQPNIALAPGDVVC